MSSDTKKDANASGAQHAEPKVRARSTRSDAAPNRARHHEWRRVSSSRAPTLDELKNALRSIDKTDS
jgi:hypothetical protein